MKIAVLIEPVPGNGFRAKGGEPLAMSAEGATRAEAIARLKTLIANRLTVGTELIGLELGAEEHSLAPVSGWTKDDPLLDEWQQAVLDYRRHVEDDPDRPLP
jgi:hypothetical protein